MPNFSKLATTSSSSSPPNNQPTRIPATRMDAEEDIMDDTFGDSLASLSDSFSSMPSEEFLEIIDDHQRQGRYRSRIQRKRTYICALLFVTCATAVALSVALIPRKGRAGGVGSGSGPASSSSSSSSPSWEDVCSHDSVTDEAGRKECVDACNLYACCALHPDEAGSCAVSRAADCVRFWGLCTAVGVADEKGKGGEGVVIPAAPDDLVDLCSAVAIIASPEGREACEQACSPGSCCIVEDPHESCVEVNEDVCLDYQVCELLHVQDDAADGSSMGAAVIPSAPGDLTDLCSPERIATTEEWNACQQACRPGFCCIAEDPTESCIDGNEDVCLDYQVCDLLHIGSEEQDYAALADICENANRDKKKFEACSRICQDRMCCFDMLGGGCKDIAEYKCLVYEPCSVLVVDEAQAIVQNVAHSQGSAELFSLLETCSDENIAKPDKLEKCLKECKARECCFNPEHNCFGEAEGWCDEFVVCLNAFSQVTEELEHTEEQQSPNPDNTAGGG